jgi:hypothetical protein
MAARKKTATKKAARKGTPTKKSARSTSKGRGRRLALNAELPEPFLEMSRRVREGLGRLEKEISDTEARYRKGFMQILDEVGDQLAELEAVSEERWHTISDKARRDLADMLRKLEKVVEPGKRRPRKKSAARKKKVARARG